MCKGNPSKRVESPANPMDESAAFDELLTNALRNAERRRNPRTRQLFSSSLIAAFIVIGGLIFISLPTYVQLTTEYGYPFSSGTATYHFIVDDPARAHERLYLNIKMRSVLPTIVSFAPMRFDATLIPANNVTNQTLPEKYVLLISGSNCDGYPEIWRYSDGTCKIPLQKQT